MRNVKSFVFGIVSLVGVIAVYVALSLTPFADESANSILKFSYIFALLVFFVLPITGLFKNRGFSAGMVLCIVSIVIQVLMIILAITCSL